MPKEQCQRCNKRVADLHFHLVSCIDRYDCDMCPKFFKSKSRLRDHKRGHGENVIKCEECVTCVKTFSNTSNLRAHMRKFHSRIVEHAGTTSNIDSLGNVTPTGGGGGGGGGAAGSAVAVAVSSGTENIATTTTAAAAVAALVPAAASNLTPLKGIPSRVPTSGFRSPNVSTNQQRPNLSRTPAGRKDGGIKIIEFTDQPLGYAAAKKRKREQQLEEQQKKQEQKQAAAPPPSPPPPTLNVSAATPTTTANANASFEIKTETPTPTTTTINITVLTTIGSSLRDRPWKQPGQGLSTPDCVGKFVRTTTTTTKTINISQTSIDDDAAMDTHETTAESDSGGKSDTPTKAPEYAPSLVTFSQPSSSSSTPALPTTPTTSTVRQLKQTTNSNNTIGPVIISQTIIQHAKRNVNNSTPSTSSASGSIIRNITQQQQQQQLQQQQTAPTQYILTSSQPLQQQQQQQVQQQLPTLATFTPARATQQVGGTTTTLYQTTGGNAQQPTKILLKTSPTSGAVMMTPIRQQQQQQPSNASPHSNSMDTDNMNERHQTSLLKLLDQFSPLSSSSSKCDTNQFVELSSGSQAAIAPNIMVSTMKKKVDATKGGGGVYPVYISASKDLVEFEPDESSVPQNNKNTYKKNVIL